MSLNVYVISTDKYWFTPQRQLLEAQATHLVNLHMANGRWETIKGALPYGHHLTGSFFCRNLLPDNALFFGPAFDGLSNDITLVRSANVWSNERQRLQSMKKSDACFVWIDGAMDPNDYGDIMMIHGMGKEVFVACSDGRMLYSYPMLMEIMRDKAVSSSSLRQGYETVMADISVKIESKFILMTSKYGGLCRGCGGSYVPEDPIMWSRVDGVYHKDCYEMMKDPDKANAALFNANVVGALRTRLKELEEENTSLMVRNSILERQLKGET